MVPGLPPGNYYGEGYHNTAFQIFGGWRFSPYLALEGSYMNLGSYSEVGTSFHDDTQGFAPAFSHYYNDFAFGGGIGVTIANRFAVRAEADRLNLANTYDTYAWWVTLAYHC